MVNFGNATNIFYMVKHLLRQKKERQTRREKRIRIPGLGEPYDVL